MRKPIVVSLLALLACAGCTNTVNTVDVKDGGAVKTNVTDSKLNDVASVGNVRKVRDGTGLLKVQADLTNTTGDQAKILYKFDWLDSTGMVIETPLSAWKKQIIEGGQTVSISDISPDTRAVDCKIELQRIDRE